MMDAPFAASGVGRGEPASDFAEVLRRRGLWASAPLGAAGPNAPIAQTQATTILAFKFHGGVMVAGDRRATAGNTVVFDRADKVLEIDRHSIMAIAGVPATAWEMARVLEHSFQFFRRTQLQEMSVDGKVRALSKLLRDNFGFVMQGAGVVVPIFATYDAHGPESGAALLLRCDGGELRGHRIRGHGVGFSRGARDPALRESVGKEASGERSESDAVTIALRALDTAAEADTATGGVDRNAKIFPVIKIVSRDGITTLADKQISAAFKSSVA